MKLSQKIKMIEDWLDHCAYGYQIYKVESLGENWRVHFYEYAPLGNIECDTYFDIPFKRNCLINALGNDVLDIGKDAYSTDKEFLKWFEEFEKKWNYDTGKKKVKVFYTKTIEVEVELEQKDINMFAVDGPPDWITEKANEIDNEQPLELEGFKVEEGE